MAGRSRRGVSRGSRIGRTARLYHCKLQLQLSRLRFLCCACDSHVIASYMSAMISGYIFSLSRQPCTSKVYKKSEEFFPVPVVSQSPCH